MARTFRSRAPAPPGAANGPGTLAEAPLGGTRSEAIRRFQMGAVGVVAVLVLIGLASLIKDRATQTDSTAVAGAAATMAPSASTAAADPLAEAGVVPEMPGSPPDGLATAAAATTPPPATARPAGAEHHRMLARALALAAMLAGRARVAAPRPMPRPHPGPARLGLMTTLPIYWPEAHDVGEMLQASAKPTQVRQALETRFVLEPVDTLEPDTLRGHERLMLAQPRALSPVENVALDRWVRDGGRLLLFADPMLTHHSHFGIGDKRRAQDVILLSPILTHWGLTLAFDPDQAAAERAVDVAGIAVTVALSGQLDVLPGGTCEIAGEGVLARCRIGRGSVTILADAAVLDDAEGADFGLRREALLALTRLAFD